MTYQRVCAKSNMADVTCGEGTAYTFGTPKYIPWFYVRFVVFNLLFLV